MSELWKQQADGIVHAMLESGEATWLAKNRVNYSSIFDMHKEEATEYVRKELEKRRGY